MKNIKNTLSLLAGMFLMSVTVSFAQVATDTTQNVREGNPQMSEPQFEESTNYTKDMVKIKAADVPKPVQQALQSTEYKGWENAAIYRSKSSDMYLVEMKDGDKTKTYRFDRNGKPIKE
ncbi:MAG TPA: hypothetical protein VIU12_24220 [Chryseolinea sp.]